MFHAVEAMRQTVQRITCDSCLEEFATLRRITTITFQADLPKPFHYGPSELRADWCDKCMKLPACELIEKYVENFKKRGEGAE